MQLLFEEFFKKVNSLSEGKTSLTLKILVKTIFYSLIAISLILIVYLIYTKKYIIILIILGLAIIGESAHYIRKTREKIIINKVSNEKLNTKELLKSGKSKNKVLLETNDDKNNSLLKKEGTKNIEKKRFGKKINFNKKIGKKEIGRVKNKNLLKMSEPKNKELLKVNVKDNGLLRG